MSKNKQPEKVNDESRQSRKEVLIAKKEAEQTRGIRIGIGIVVGLILVIILIGVINEFVVSPNRDVATVENQPISLKEFQNRVKYERIQRIILLESQLKAFGGDVGIIQQFAGQMIMDMMPANSDVFGETVLNQMVDEIVIKQAAAARGIEISEADIDEAIGARFGYYGGGLPTPLPAATETVVPTPSLTPIATAVITELLPTATPLPEPTVGPTAEPLPTATAVSEEAFQQEFADFFKDYEANKVSQAQYREGIRMSLLRDRLALALAEEAELSTEAEHANFFVIATADQAEAEETVSAIATDGFLPVWNEIRSKPFDPELASTIVAAELLQRTEDDLSQTFGPDVASAVFDLAIDRPSGVVTAVGQDGTQQYFIVMVSGREMKELAETTLQMQRDTIMSTYLQAQREKAVITDIWRGRVPTLPLLDSKFLAQATATPFTVQQPEATVSP